MAVKSIAPFTISTVAGVAGGSPVTFRTLLNQMVEPGLMAVPLKFELMVLIVGESRSSRASRKRRVVDRRMG